MDGRRSGRRQGSKEALSSDGVMSWNRMDAKTKTFLRLRVDFPLSRPASVPMRCNQYPPDQKLPFRDGIESDAKRNSSSPSTRNSCYLALTSTVAPLSLRHVYSEINTQEMGMFARSARDCLPRDGVRHRCVSYTC